MKYEVGMKCEQVYQITGDIIDQYAELSGDYNDIHVNEEEAQKSIFGGRIAHGMLLGGYISSIIGMKFPGKGTIYLEQDLKFLAPVKIDSEVIVCVEVAEIINEQKQILKLRTCVEQKEDKKLLIDGFAVVKVKKHN